MIIQIARQNPTMQINTTPTVGLFTPLQMARNPIRIQNSLTLSDMASLRGGGGSMIKRGLSLSSCVLR